MIKVNIIKSLLILPLILCSVNSYALTCYEKSPAFEKEGDKYYGMVETYQTLTDKQKMAVKVFFASFEGERLKGSGTTTECAGPDKSPIERVQQEELKGNVSVLSDGELVIKLDVFNKNNNTGKGVTLKFFDSKSLQIVNKLTSSDIHLAMKVRLKGAKGGSRLLEDLVEFNVDGKALNITTTRYAAGYLISRSLRKLYFK